MPLHDINYKHWQGEHLDVWGRRWVIARNGLTACLQVRFMINLVVICWGLGLAAAAVLFLIGQLLVADSVVVRWVSTFNPNLQIFANLLTLWLRDHPEISVGTTQNVLFYFFGSWLMLLSIFALGPIIPLLITRDLSSNAIVIYSSKAITRGDYFFGKFATAFGFLCLTWLGPVCAAWFLGNLLAPDWSFFWHARSALMNILLYGLSSMTILSLLAMGVSSLSGKERFTTALWFIWWIVGAAINPIAINTRQPWLQHLGFGFNIHEIALYTFRVGEKIERAKASIQILSDMLNRGPRASAMSAYDTPNIASTVVALVLMLSLAAWLLNKRVKPE
jgi:ABC-2 type transport system permease protein